MNEFEDKLNALLNDPGQMERFASFAKSVMGGSAPPDTAPEAPDIDMGMIKRVSALLSGAEAKSSKDKRLLEAMRPYLSEKRRGKMDRAMKIARLASIASIAAEELGGDGSGDV